jgi:hypothetical protein
MPSRQDAILKSGEFPVTAMRETARNLERAGADFIIIGANTPHYFYDEYDEIKNAVRIPFLHIIAPIQSRLGLIVKQDNDKSSQHGRLRKPTKQSERLSKWHKRKRDKGRCHDLQRKQLQAGDNGPLTLQHDPHFVRYREAQGFVERTTGRTCMQDHRVNAISATPFNDDFHQAPG